jgi:hypothetical protein
MSRLVIAGLAAARSAHAKNRRIPYRAVSLEAAEQAAYRKSSRMTLPADEQDGVAMRMA